MIDNVGDSLTTFDPEVDNASANPTGTLTQKDQTLAINVSDADFPTDKNDSVEIRWFKNGSQFDSSRSTLTSPAIRSSG